MLIVDEFQEFFVNDDKLAHEASLLLDRLVRQGRAFGIHVVLGSQTLAGAYSLARSTIGQMAVRIALECSAADAHLILSEDNTAARLLGRPGEAIYNDANGRLEGNHPFQVVWLPDEQRNQYLQEILRQSDETQRNDPPAIVFEGHAAAELAENADLRRLIEVGPSRKSPPPPRVWLGAPIEIKEPTSITFRRQGGTNLLIIGQSRETARGLLSSCLLSLAATHMRATADQPTRRAQFCVLDGERAEHIPSAFADALQPYLSLPLHTAGPVQVHQALEDIAETVDQRLANPEVPHESVYIVIHDLARFRELQPTADEFGLGGFGEAAEATCASQLTKILRNGPAVGIHTLVWADCYHTVSRWLDRQALRDFGQRVLLQMSATDSSHLMDSAAAAQLVRTVPCCTTKIEAKPKSSARTPYPRRPGSANFSAVCKKLRSAPSTPIKDPHRRIPRRSYDSSTLIGRRPRKRVPRGDHVLWERVARGPKRVDKHHVPGKTQDADDLNRSAAQAAK